MSKISLSLVFTILVMQLLVFDDFANCQKKKNTRVPKNNINLIEIHRRNNGLINSNNGKRSRNKNTGKNGRNKNTGKGKTRITKGNSKNSNFLSVRKGKLFYKKQQIFLSGVNIAYINYASDFGNGAYTGVKSRMESYLSQISAAGGNAVRIYLHGDGRYTPKLDSNGFANGEDTASLIQELGQFLDAAANNNILVIIGLWNCGDKLPQTTINLFKDEKKLTRYLDKVLKPLVSALKTKKALGIWDIVNEPEGSVSKDIADTNLCFNTQNLITKGGDWTMNNITMKELLRFANLHSAAIKVSDQKALKYISSREEETSDYCDLCRNYWTDKCLVAAGGKASGIVDLYHMETFTWQNHYYGWSPMKKLASDYKLTKPIVVGSLSSACSESNSSAFNFNYLYSSGYAGALNWQYSEQGYCFDTVDKSNQGMNAIRDMTVNGVIKISVS